jgi:RNA polymerase sigma-70 factor (ECF subfamily)
VAQPATDGRNWGDVLSDDTPDADLVARSLQGRQDAFEVLFDRYARQVYNIAYRISGSSTEAEDLTQDIFMRAFRTLGTLRQPQAFAAWLYQMATNVCLDGVRRRRVPQAELSEAVVSTYPDESRWRSPEAVALASDDQHAVWEVLARLAPSQRTALALRELYGLSYGDIAATLGTSVGAVEVLIFRARRRFREQYAKVAAGASATGAASAKAASAPCKEVRASLATVLDDEQGTGKERAAALTHVRNCPTCQAEIAAQRRDLRARALLPLLPLPIVLKGHVLTHVASAIGAAGGGAAATGAMGVTGATLATSLSAATGAPAAAASSATTAGTAAAVVTTTSTSASAATATAAATALGAKIGVLAVGKALLVAAAIATVAAVAVTPLLRGRQAHPASAKRAATGQSARGTSAGGSRFTGQSIIGTRLTLLARSLRYGSTVAPRPRLPRPSVRAHPTHATARGRRRSIATARQAGAREVRPRLVKRAPIAKTTWRTRAARRPHPTYRATHAHVTKRVTTPRPALRKRAQYPVAHKQVRRLVAHKQARRPVAHKQAPHRPVARNKAVTPRRVTHRTVVPRPAQHKRVAHRRTGHKPARHAAPRAALSVTWRPLGRFLRFDQRQMLRLHTRPGALVDVTLRIVRVADPHTHSLGPRGPRIYRVTMRARADRHGDASVPLRYSYVPTRPMPVTLTVAVHDGRRTTQRVAHMTLVRR